MNPLVWHEIVGNLLVDEQIQIGPAFGFSLRHVYLAIQQARAFGIKELRNLDGNILDHTRRRLYSRFYLGQAWRCSTTWHYSYQKFSSNAVLTQRVYSTCCRSFIFVC